MHIFAPVLALLFYTIIRGTITKRDIKDNEWSFFVAVATYPLIWMIIEMFNHYIINA